MPAHKKPAGTKQDKRPQRGAALVVVPAAGEVPAVAPRPNPKWLAVTKSSWETFWTDDVASALTPSERDMVRRAFALRDRAERCFRRYDDQPYVDGSKGQPVANPALADALALERAAVALEDRLAMNPKARVALGLEIGKAALTADELNRRALQETDDDHPEEAAGVIEVDSEEAALLEGFS